MSASRLLQLVLRIDGVLTGLAAFAVVMPRSWMALCHEALGLGVFPEGPIVEYMARSLSALYAMHGVIAWVVASDVHRHAPVIRCFGVLGLVFGAAIFVIDLRISMPIWWTVFEGPSVVVLSVAILLLQGRRVAPTPQPATSAG